MITKQAVKDWLWLAGLPLLIAGGILAGMYFGVQPAHGAVRGVSPGTATPINPTQIISAGTASMTGCSLTAPSNTAPAGQFTSGTTGACAVTLTLAATKTAYACWATDTAGATVGGTSGAGSTTTCTVSLTTTSGDVVRYFAIGF